jgi:hypothetical protein
VRGSAAGVRQGLHPAQVLLSDLARFVIASGLVERLHGAVRRVPLLPVAATGFGQLDPSAGQIDRGGRVAEEGLHDRERTEGTAEWESKLFGEGAGVLAPRDPVVPSAASDREEAPVGEETGADLRERLSDGVENGTDHLFRFL